MRFIELRELGLELNQKMWQLAAAAFELIDWVHKSIFCGRCGDLMQFSKNEFARKCPSCNLIQYSKFFQ